MACQVSANHQSLMCWASLTFTLRKYFIIKVVYQGPKLTFLGRRPLATEFFFQSPYAKMWSPKSVNRIFPSQRNTSRWKILVARMSRTRLGPFALTNKIKCKHADYLYTKTQATAKCQSTLYLLLCPTKKLLFGSLLFVQNDLSFHILSRRSTDCQVARTRPQLCSISCSIPPELSATRMLWETAEKTKLRTDGSWETLNFI